MSHTPVLSPRPHQENCTGQGCADRQSCLRYLREASRPYVDKSTGERVVQLWASYDIERQRLGGPCPTYKPLRSLESEASHVQH